MAELTFTRKTLRRAIAVEMQMPFFRRFPAGESGIDAASTTTKIIDASLNQRQDFWSGHWFYGLVAGDVSLIRDFSPADHSFRLETPMAGTPQAADLYEIHSIWNAVDIHDAINRAVEEGSRYYPETVVDKTMVFCEDQMQYDITGLTKRPFQILKVYGEKPSVLIRGAVASAAVGNIVIAESATTLTGVSNGYLVSIYAGTGQNQVRTVSSVVGTQVNVSVNWTTTPDSTSKYAIWNPAKQRYDWERLDIFYTDSNEYPDELRLRTRLPYYYGMRIRLEYLFANVQLTADTDTTIVPREYVVAKACAILHARKMKDTKADRDLHFAEFQRNEKVADDFMLRNAPHLPGTTIPASDSPTYMDVDDPLGWFPGR